MSIVHGVTFNGVTETIPSLFERICRRRRHSQLSQGKVGLFLWASEIRRFRHPWTILKLYILKVVERFDVFNSECFESYAAIPITDGKNKINRTQCVQ